MSNVDDFENLAACSLYTDAAYVWEAAGWHVFIQDDEEENVGAVHCVHARTGKILLFGLNTKSSKSWPEQVLMTLCKMTAEKI
jgi:hypothetical protein